MKYKKPTRLSDPGGDFSPEELNGILLKQDVVSPCPAGSGKEVSG